MLGPVKCVMNIGEDAGWPLLCERCKDGPSHTQLILKNSGESRKQDEQLAACTEIGWYVDSEDFHSARFLELIKMLESI